MNLYGSSGVGSLVTAVYPRLHAYMDPDQLKASDLPLSWKALMASECHLFLLEARTSICIYLADRPLAEAADDTSPEHTLGFAFPPARDTAIWQHVETIRRQEFNQPRVVVGHAGTDEGTFFEAHLIEDDQSAIDSEGGFSLGQFLEFQAQQVTRYIEGL